MTGRPRARHARLIADWLAYELEAGGPATARELLDRIGHGDRDALTPRQIAATNMAIREFLRGAVALDPWTDRWHCHRRGTPAPGGKRP
jgi:hypothetical protein